MPITGSFEQFRLDILDPRHGQGGGIAGQPPVYPDGSCDEGRAWAHALGSAQDRELVLLRTAALCRLPKLCPDDALDRLGQGEFLLERYPSETDDAYRARLEQAFPIYALGGTALAVISSLRAYGFGGVSALPIFEASAPIAPATSATSYGEFYVFLGPDVGDTGVLPLFLGSGTLGSPPVTYTWTLGDASSVLGSTLTRDQIVAVKRQILRWKAAHGYPVKVFLLFGSQTSADAPALCAYSIGRVLGSTPPGSCVLVLGDSFILGGYAI